MCYDARISHVFPGFTVPAHGYSHTPIILQMARLFVTIAALVAACATVNAFQVPRMSLDKYRSELAETAKKIASPGTLDRGDELGRIKPGARRGTPV